MKRVFGKALLVCLMVALLSVAAFASAEADDGAVTIKLANKTNKMVYVALARMSEGGDDSNDLVQGWFNVKPGKTRTVKFGNYSPVYEYFFYAVSGKRVWAGNKDNGSTFWIHPKNAFKNRGPEKKISGGKRVVFKHISVSSDGKGRINFTEK